MNIAQTIYLSMALVVCSSLMIACNPTANSNNMNIIDINPAWQQHPIECDHAITINNQQWQLQYLRFYLSDVKLDQQPQYHDVVTIPVPAPAPAPAPTVIVFNMPTPPDSPAPPRPPSPKRAPSYFREFV